MVRILKKNIIIIFSLILIKVTLNAECTISDYKQYFSKCDKKTNKRTITIYRNSDCEVQNELTLNTSNLLSLYSKLPSYEIDCDLECKGGEKMEYDPINNEVICKKCPKNTYNLGANYKVISNWKESDLKKFTFNCYAIDYSGYKLNEDCTGLTLSSDKSMLVSGELTGKQIKYFIQAFFYFSSQNYGRIILKYRKDTSENAGYINGNLKIFLDYKVIKSDFDKNTDWDFIYHDFSPGEHELVFFYWYIKSYNNNNYKFYIEHFEIIGFDNPEKECNSCENSISDEGSEICYSCNMNFYFDNKSKSCIKCKDNEFSIPHLFLNQCYKKKKCNEFDYEIDKIGKCVNNKKNIILVPIKPIYCSDYKENILKEVPCNINKDKSNEEKCKDGMIFSNIFKYDFYEHLINEFFDKNIGFKSNDNSIFTGNYIGDENEKILVKNFNIKNLGYLKLKFDLNLDKEESFIININLEKEILTGVKKLDIEKIYSLKPGENSLIMIYESNSKELKFENSLTIKEIIIYGSDLSEEKILIKCPFGTISKNKCSKCEKCLENEIPNLSQNECIKCKNGLAKIINNEYKCVECPSYTYYDGNNCLLNEVIFQNQNKLRFNLYPIKDYINRLCNDQSGLLCYDNSFIGPISKYDDKNIKNENQRDLFFISLFEPKTININDFVFDEDKSNIKNGQIFGLFNIDSFEISNELFKNLTFKNTKKKKNLGVSIKKIDIINQEINRLTELGLFIEFNEGDKCISDPNRNYKSYLYLKCNKYEISSPKLINILDNNCTYVFEWFSPYICKNCVVKELKKYERGTCKNGIRKIVFDSNNDCLIFNITGTKLKGYEIDYTNNLLDINNDFYKNLIGDNFNNYYRNIAEVTYEGSDFDFEYIESNIYNQKCSIFDNIDEHWKKYLFLIPLLYFITFIGVVIYCCKYKKIKDKYYQRLSTTPNKIKNTNLNHLSEVKDISNI